MTRFKSVEDRLRSPFQNVSRFLLNLLQFLDLLKGDIPGPGLFSGFRRGLLSSVTV